MLRRRRWPGLLGVVIAIIALSAPSPVGAVAGFGDVQDGMFYSAGVQWLADSGITTGTSPECFSPDAAVTRGQAAAFLWRMEGRSISPPHPFGDVEAGWQQGAVSWMSAERITTGTAPSTFSPDQVATRAQIAAFLYRLAGEPPAGGLPFGDLTAAWQRAPVAWMSAAGITTGTSLSEFSPDAPVTRAQVATFLHRYKGLPPVEIDPFSPYCDGSALTAELQALVAPLDPGRPAYDRDLFFEGADLDDDCVRTRHEVLQEEALEYSMSGCRVTAGTWFDPFTAAYFYDPVDLEVDHVVALADAWHSGAWAWDDAQREIFSNDISNLNAIKAEENSRKSDAGPSHYRPSNTGQNCAYLLQYGSVKVAYGLSVTPADFDAVRVGLAGCSSVGPDAPHEEPSPPSGCHAAYLPCIPNFSGDALNCGDLTGAQKPVTVLDPGVDPFGFDGDGDGIGCE